MSSTKPLRIGIVGLGIGRFHASFFAAQPGVTVAAVADRSGRRVGGSIESFAAHYGASAYHSGEEMLSSEALDAVAICSAPASHRQLVECAAARGVHVLLEKPMAWSLADCDAIERACQRAGVRLAVNFPMRTLPPVATLKRLLTEGDLGAPAVIAADYVMGPRPADHWVWSGEGGPLTENSCHTVDLLHYLFGPIEDLAARGANALGPGHPLPDCACVALRFRSGAIGTLVGGAIATTELGVPPRLTVYATKGQAIMDGAHHTFTTLRWARRGDTAQEQHAALAPVQPSALGTYDRYPLIEGSLAQFLADLRASRPASAAGRDGRAAVETCLAIARAVEQDLEARAGRRSSEPAAIAAV